MQIWQQLLMERDKILFLFFEHVQLTAVAVLLAILIGVPLGILMTYVARLNRPILGFANLIQAIPSLALLGFMVPLLGLGPTPAVFMVVVYSLLPIVKNTYTGLANIAPEMLETAKGIGMTRFQVLFRVRLPLSLSVIMAGVRISAVTAVGLVTIAALIGAGGLGELIYAGIRTATNAQIVAGAIPACVLALLMDHLLADIEKLVTPKALRPPAAAARGGLRPAIGHTVSALTAVIVVLAIGVYVHSLLPRTADKRTITVAGKDFTEQILLAHIYADLIEAKTDLRVNRKVGLGGSQVVFNALIAGDVDMYVDYTGTLYGSFLKHPPLSDIKKVYDISKQELAEKYNLILLPQIGFNNTYTLTMRREKAAALGIRTISDLARVAPDLRLAATVEFMNREDGWLGLRKAYGLEFAKIFPTDGSPRFVAIAAEHCDVIDAFSTEGLIKGYDLQILEDDRQFFLPYFAVPLIRGEILEKHPELRDVVAILNGILTNETMQELNYQIDELKRDPMDVAREFLRKQALIDN